LEQALAVLCVIARSGSDETISNPEQIQKSKLQFKKQRPSFLILHFDFCILTFYGIATLRSQ